MQIIRYKFSYLHSKYYRFVAPVNQKLHVEKVENHEVTPTYLTQHITHATDAQHVQSTILGRIYAMQNILAISSLATY